MIYHKSQKSRKTKLNPKDWNMKKFTKITSSIGPKSGSKEMLEKIFDNFRLSVRSYHKLLKIARTIADLEGSGKVLTRHLQEAACYQVRDWP